MDGRIDDARGCSDDERDERRPDDDADDAPTAADAEGRRPNHRKEPSDAVVDR